MMRCEALRSRRGVNDEMRGIKVAYEFEVVDGFDTTLGECCWRRRGGGG